MTEPRIELITGRSGICWDEAIVLDVLIRITPPQPEVHFPRTPLNLALVLDRSGSMAGGRKMPFAREAATFAVKQLLPTDRVSVTVFDNEVETIVPGGTAADKVGLVRRIEQIMPRGSTDLHGGWAEGGRQAEAGLVSGGVNRVLLLSDGLANVGVVDPNTIAAEARGLAARGVGTTTMGVGEDYNEDLMEAMARAGDGRYYYIESPAQLVDIFQTELQGLMDTLGEKVSLGLVPRNGVVVTDVLNDLEKASSGRLMLPNLVMDMPVLVVVPVEGAAIAPGDTAGRLSTGVGRPAKCRAPGVARGARWAAGFADRRLVGPSRRFGGPDAGRLADGRARRKGSRSSRGTRRVRGDTAIAGGVPRVVQFGATVDRDSGRGAGVDELEAALDSGSKQAFVKNAKYRSYRRSQSQPPGGEQPSGR